MGFSVSPGYLLLGAVQQRQVDSLVDFGVRNDMAVSVCESQRV